MYNILISEPSYYYYTITFSLGAYIETRLSIDAISYFILGKGVYCILVMLNFKWETRDWLRESRKQ